MTTAWDTSRISALLCSTFAPQLARSQASEKAPPSATIDVLLTFDAGGVSGHPNHASLYRGARAFAAALVRGKPGWAPPVDLYTLTSVSLWRKYASLLDTPATLLAWALRTSMRDKKRPAGLVFMSGLGGGGGVWAAWRAMTTAHRSQMVWFRWGWILLSRYMVMNDLRLEKIS